MFVGHITTLAFITVAVVLAACIGMYGLSGCSLDSLSYVLLLDTFPWPPTPESSVFGTTMQLFRHFYYFFYSVTEIKKCQSSASSNTCHQRHLRIISVPLGPLVYFILWMFTLCARPPYWWLPPLTMFIQFCGIVDCRMDTTEQCLTECLDVFALHACSFKYTAPCQVVQCIPHVDHNILRSLT